MKTCSTCGAPITYSKPARGWLHAEPLALMRVSHWEAADIMAASPDRFKHTGGYRTVLHPALPRRSF